MCKKHLCSVQEEWLDCQRSWLYLESIFSAPDIQRQLPAEAKMFLQVDKSYKDIMRKVNKVPLAIRAATQPGKLSQVFCIVFMFSFPSACYKDDFSKQVLKKIESA